MTPSSHPQAAYFTQQYNVRALTPNHPEVFDRWNADSAHLRRTAGGLFDIAYGESPAERLDFFPTYGSGAPLMVFIRGGWWRSLDKSEFSFIAAAYTRAGINIALPNYSHAPQASVADITRENLRALAWLYRHAEQYDFDPGRIVIAGHSAGAHLAAMMMSAIWPAYGADLPHDLVKGGILLSGLYDLEPVRHADFVNIDLKLTEEDIGLLSPAAMPPAYDIPFVTAVGGRETDEFKRQNKLIGQKWKAGHQGDIVLQDDDHLTICDAFALPGTPLFEAAKNLIKKL
ncbi:MAG: alpha/beta hydrolase [Paucimonas sp.]|jgi:arylformamidase|nr:alpha/beta hydrolase [Paucimonas sp.]